MLSLEPKKDLSCFSVYGSQSNREAVDNRQTHRRRSRQEGWRTSATSCTKTGVVGKLIASGVSSKKSVALDALLELTDSVLLCVQSHHSRSHMWSRGTRVACSPHTKLHHWSLLSSRPSRVESSSPQSLNVCALDNSFRCRSYVCCCLLISVSFDYLLTYRKTPSSQSEARSRESSTLTERGCLPP